MRIILFFTFLSSIIHAQETKPEHKLLWEISAKGIKHKSYLYASYHSNDKRVFNLSDSTYIALLNAKSVAIETDIYALFKTWDTRQSEIKTHFDREGHLYTNSNDASSTIYGSEDGMPQFLDLYFLQYALNANKEYYALEPIEDQLSLVDDITPYLLDEKATRFINIQDRALELYISGNIDALERSLRTSLKYNKDYFNKLIIKRNEIMSIGIDSLVRKQSTFVAVGAAHLSGEKGLINLLRSKGFTVRPVQASFTTPVIEAKKQILATKNYVYFDPETKLKAIFPGKPFEIDQEGSSIYLIFRELGQGNTYSIEVFEKQDGHDLEQIANDYIQSPGDAKKYIYSQDDGSTYIEGISNSYPEGIAWVRVIEGNSHYAVLKAYGGNKFMNSSRPQNFFDKTFFEY